MPSNPQGAITPGQEPSSWDHPCSCMERDGWPMAIGRRVFWGRTEDGSRPISLPVVAVESIYRDGVPLNEMHGFIADLATENGVTVDLTYDPHEYAIEDQDVVSVWLYVVHPETGNRCAATVKDGQAVYDAWCGDEDRCEHEHGGWFEYVHRPEQVFEHLRMLGSLTIKARIERPTHVG